MTESKMSRRDFARTAGVMVAAGAGLGAAVRVPSSAAQTSGPGFHVPGTISTQAQAAVREFDPSVLQATMPPPDDLDSWTRAQEENEIAFKEQNEQVVRQYGPTVMRTRLGGVSVLDIKPRDWRETAEVLVYTHGGAYTLFSAESTLISAVPVAHDTGRRVISVDYTLAPFSKWPETTDQVVAVIKAVLEDGRGLENVAIYGDSAGGGLAAGSVLKMRDRELGLPAAVVLWSPWSDIAEIGDTYFTLKEADPLLDYSKQLKNSADAYADPGDQKHPYVSPVYADYGKGFPPTLIQGGTKEIFLSNFIRHYQALDLAGVTAKLDLFEGMWHVFQAFHSDLLESRLARQKMKRFLDAHVKA